MKKILFLLLPVSIAVIASFTLKSPPQAGNNFIIKASQSNMAEIEAGRIATEKASTDSVKMFAKMMVDDHTAAQNELESLAKAHNITLPPSADQEHKTLVTNMSNLSGAAFDKAYIKSQVKDHRKAVALFQQEASSGTGDTKAYAAKYLPKLQMHLQMALDAAGGKGAGGKGGGNKGVHQGMNGKTDSARH